MTPTITHTLMQQIAEKFESYVPNLAGGNEGQSLRRKAMESFLNSGFPTKKNEEYKYLSSEKILPETFEIASTKDLKKYTLNEVKPYFIASLNAINLVMINGIFMPELSDINAFPANTIVAGLQQAFTENPELISNHYGKYLEANNDAFAKLNVAMANDGIFIFVDDNTTIEKPIHIVNIIDTNAHVFIQPHHVIIVGKSSSLQVFESFNTIVTSSKYLLNNVTEMVVNENAKAQYYKLQRENDQAHQVNNMQVWQAVNSHFDTNVITIGGAWIRNNLNIELKGKNCETHLNGLQLLSGHQQVDNHTLVDHQMPHCESNQLYKGILNDKSTGVFNGKIYVRKDAQKTNAYQSSKNMLLSDDATINTKPQLEIYADDVKCSHGSTTGRIDEEALFYLKSRGIGEVAAKNLLLMAFAGDVTKTISNVAFREYIENLIAQHLHLN